MNKQQMFNSRLRDAELHILIVSYRITCFFNLDATLSAIVTGPLTPSKNSDCDLTLGNLTSIYLSLFVP